jgi:hypothetical protein
MKRKNKRDEPLPELELKFIREALDRDQGNTMRRYLDPQLRKQLGLPPRKQYQSSAVKPVGSAMFPRWDPSMRFFIVYRCKRHGFDPDQDTVHTKCLARNCLNLILQKRSELWVRSLQEAVEIKNRLGGVWIEPVKGGFRLFKEHRH